MAIEQGHSGAQETWLTRNKPTTGGPQRFTRRKETNVPFTGRQ